MFAWLTFAAFAAPQSVSEDDLDDALAEVQAREGQFVIVGSTWTTHAPLKAAAARRADLNVEIKRVPEGRTDAEAALQAAIEKAGVRCALWVTDAGTGRFSFNPVGDCRPAVGAPAPEPPPLVAQPAAPRPATPVAPAAPAAPPAPATAPAPPPRIASPDDDDDDDRWELLVEMTAPDPTSAFLQSAFIGFGAGHFYANDADTGYVHLGVQLGGVAVTAIGAGMAASGEESGAWIQLAGVTAIGVSRIVELVSVPYAVRRERERMVNVRR